MVSTTGVTTMRHAFHILTLCVLASCGSGSSTEADAAKPAKKTAAAPAPAPAPAPVQPPAVPIKSLSKAELAQKVCFFTPAEIEQKLGFSVANGVADTTRLESYGMASCVYDGSNNSLRITAFWLDPSQVAGTRAGMTRMSGGGKVEALPGDPDSGYLHDQQDNGTSLHYLRQNIRMQLHVTSSRPPFAVMKPKLLSLRRVP
jgi:hypothetical protein